MPVIACQSCKVRVRVPENEHQARRSRCPRCGEALAAPTPEKPNPTFFLGSIAAIVAVGLCLISGVYFYAQSAHRTGLERKANESVASDVRDAQERMGYRRWDEAAEILQRAVGTKHATELA